jgi:hypothetical protein
MRKARCEVELELSSKSTPAAASLSLRIEAITVISSVLVKSIVPVCQESSTPSNTARSPCQIGRLAAVVCAAWFPLPDRSVTEPIGSPAEFTSVVRALSWNRYFARVRSSARPGSPLRNRLRGCQAFDANMPDGITTPTAMQSAMQHHHDDDAVVRERENQRGKNVAKTVYPPRLNAVCDGEALLDRFDFADGGSAHHLDDLVDVGGQRGRIEQRPWRRRHRESIRFRSPRDRYQFGAAPAEAGVAGIAIDDDGFDARDIDRVGRKRHREGEDGPRCAEQL